MPDVSDLVARLRAHSYTVELEAALEAMQRERDEARGFAGLLFREIEQIANLRDPDRFTYEARRLSCAVLIEQTNPGCRLCGRTAEEEERNGAS